MSLLAHFADQDSLDLVAHGKLTLEETKAQLLAILTPYFRNPSVLERIAVLLAPEAVNLRAIEGDPQSKGLYARVTREYRAAESINSVECYAACRKWEQKILDGVAEYWSALHLNADLNNLDLHDLKFEAFRVIGMLIEAVMQPALRELLFQARLAASKAPSGDDLDQLDFGLVVEELARDFGFKPFLVPAPWNIKLSQWRNIAQHFSTRIEGEEIVALYGKGTKKHQLRLNGEELVRALETIHAASRALKTARTIFLIDNVGKVGLQEKPYKCRHEVKLLHLASTFATQGFDLVQIDVKPAEVQATVLDLTEMSPKSRMIHSSQFIYPIWLEFPRPAISVSYTRADGLLLLKSTCCGEICQEIADGRIPFEELANKVDFVLTDAGRKAFF